MMTSFRWSGLENATSAEPSRTHGIKALIRAKGVHGKPASDAQAVGTIKKWRSGTNNSTPSWEAPIDTRSVIPQRRASP
ncbi:MAG: hypothetical protein KGZ85_15275 [Ignavibacterium sp.]|nr:hypothetical protein [Ignavibacterium sp.]